MEDASEVGAVQELEQHVLEARRGDGVGIDDGLQDVDAFEGAADAGEVGTYVSALAAERVAGGACGFFKENVLAAVGVSAFEAFEVVADRVLTVLAADFAQKCGDLGIRLCGCGFEDFEPEKRGENAVLNLVEQGEQDFVGHGVVDLAEGQNGFLP